MIEDATANKDESRCRTFLFGNKIVGQDIVHKKLCGDQSIIRTKLVIRKVRKYLQAQCTACRYELQVGEN
jgi:hypothetical protein